MRVWITGAGGFLGGTLVKRLSREADAEIFALTAKPDALAEKFGTCGADAVRSASPSGGDAVCSISPGGASVARAAIHFLSRDAMFLPETESREGDILVNCAYPRNVSGEDAAAGLRYIDDVLAAAAKRRFGGILNISSQSVYSAARTAPAKETDPLSLDSIYAAGKYAVELLVAARAEGAQAAAIADVRTSAAEFCTAAARSGLPYTNIRLASLIGPGFDQRVTNRLVQAAFEKREMTVAGNPQVFGFLDVEDAAEGIVQLLRVGPKKWRTVYNLGTEKGCTLAEIAETIRDVCREDYGIDVIVHKADRKCEQTESGRAAESAKITKLTKPAASAEQAASAAPVTTTLDTQRLRADTGFVPSITLKESIRRIAAAKDRNR